MSDARSAVKDGALSWGPRSARIFEEELTRVDLLRGCSFWSAHERLLRMIHWCEQNFSTDCRGETGFAAFDIHDWRWWQTPAQATLS